MTSYKIFKADRVLIYRTIKNLGRSKPLPYKRKKGQLFNNCPFLFYFAIVFL